MNASVEISEKRRLEQAPAASTTLHSIIESDNPFRDHWYPVSPIVDLPRDRPYGIELFNTPLVVFYDAPRDQWSCLSDRCRHRAVSLSCGKLRSDGTLRCLYHGWTYDADGRCVEIPSQRNFRPDGKIRVDRFATLVHARILWVFAGATERASSVDPPELPWNDPNYYACLFVRDTEFDWLIYNEHNLDREHLQHAHPKTLGHMPKAHGVPTRVRPDTSAPKAPHLQYQQIVGPDRDKRTAHYSFFPPSTTLASTEKSNGTRHGISFAVTPLGYGRCRVIFLLYASRALPVPDFWFHIVFARVTEEDAVLIRSQMTQLANSGSLADEAFVNVSGDVVARDYRAWLRQSGGSFWQHEMNEHVKGQPAPQARTLAPESSSVYRKWEGHMHLASRYRQHFTICRTCQRAHRRFAVLRLLGFALALAAAWVALSGPKWPWVAGLVALSSCAATLGADHVMRLLKGKRF